MCLCLNVLILWDCLSLCIVRIVTMDGHRKYFRVCWRQAGVNPIDLDRPPTTNTELQHYSLLLKHAVIITSLCNGLIYLSDNDILDAKEVMLSFPPHFPPLIDDLDYTVAFGPSNWYK